MARRRSRKGEAEEHVNHERWLVSYSDMLTVLLGLFIVLYAMSQVDQAKYEALRASLSAGFGNESILVGETGVLDETDDVSAGEVEGISDVFSPVEPIDDLVVPDPQEALRAAAEAEVDRLEGVRQAIAERLAAAGLGSSVQMRITERGLVIGLVADDVFFAPASADLTATAQTVLDTIAPVLVAIQDDVAIEGHANVLPVSGRYATNWELSADRATQVLRRFVELGGLPAGRVLAVGFGDARPIASGSDPASLAQNRRVDVVVLSSAPEPVRALVPSVLGE
jgi:chemotaxis protein MotB